MILNKIVPVMIAITLIPTISGKTYSHLFAKSTTFGDVERWSDRIPCAGDKVEFDPNQVVSIFVQTNTTITEMILPMNGEFILGNNVAWGVSEDLSDCKKGNLNLKYNSDPDDWFAVKNWEIYANDALDNPVSSQDLLDMEKVPCDYDHAQFPSDTTWTVNIDNDVKLNKLNINDQWYSQSSFESYRNGDHGRYQFQGNGDVNPDGGSCNDQTGCVCRGNMDQNMLDRMCDGYDCSDTSCDDPVMAYGQCCSVCGAMVTLNYGDGYKESALNEYLQSEASKYTGAHIILSKINSQLVRATYDNGNARAGSSDLIQIVITDENTGTSTGDIAKQIAQDLQNDLETVDGISNIKIDVSGGGVVTGGGMAGGAVAALVIIVLLVFVATVLSAVYYDRVSSTVRAYAARLQYTVNGMKKEDNYDNPLYDVALDDRVTTDAFPHDDDSGQLQSFDSSITGLPSTLSTSVMDSDFGSGYRNPMYKDEEC